MASKNSATEQELLDLTRRLLTSIADGDFDTYAELCDPALTAFEPEARGQLVEGLDFHRFYFDLGGHSGPRNATLVAPRVRVWHDTGVVAYVRLAQRLDNDGQPVTSAYEETRVWQRQGGTWRHVHFHRSAAG